MRRPTSSRLASRTRDELLEDRQSRVDNTLLRAVVQAFHWKNQLEAGQFVTCVEIDPPTDEEVQTDPGVLGSFPGFNRRGLRAVPIQVSDDYNLYVNGSVNGRPARLMVDTGSFTTLLHRSFLRRMRIATRETPYSSSAVNLKERGVRVAHIRKLSVGSVDIFAKDVGVIDLEGLIHNGLLEGSPPVAGLLGAETLRRHHGIIDFGTRTLYLR